MKVTFPKIGNKHNLNPLFTPYEFFDGIKLYKQLPKTAIFIYSTRLKEELIGALSLKELNLAKKTKHNSYKHVKGLTNKSKSILVVSTGIGAPQTAVQAEELHALGVKKIIIMGTAGGVSHHLKIGEIVVCNKAVRDDGVSHHYLKNALYAYPSFILTSKIKRIMKQTGIKFKSGSTWTIDAPYMETTKEVTHYRKLGVLTVEMEAAALFSVAKKRGFQAAAVFVISDILGEKWSGFKIEKKDYAAFAQIAKHII